MDFLCLVSFWHIMNIFYLAATILASGTCGMPKLSVVTRSRAASIGARDVAKPNKGVWGAVIDKVPDEGATSSRLKRKHANVVAPGMLCWGIIDLFVLIPFRP